jgi:cell division protein FtsX
MSATYTGFIVTLSDDIGEDEAEAIAAAIRMVRGVASVKAVDADPGWQLARERLDAEWRGRIVGLLDDEGV